MTHEGPLGAETYRRAYELNNPLVEVSSCEDCGAAAAPYTCSNPNVILETVKRPADGRGIITRFYNSSAAAQTAEITLSGYHMAEVVNLLEKTTEAKHDNVLQLHGFELISIRWVKD